MAEGPPETSTPFVRYLSAKRSVDDRALNRVVLDALRGHVVPGPPDRPLRILELGAGNGTMVPRLVEWGLIARADYTALDADPAAVADGAAGVGRWAGARGLESERDASDAWRVRGPDLDLSVRMVHGDLLRFEPHAGEMDLVIANQLLDLLDVPAVLPRLWRWLRPDGFFWFTINYDGETTLEPVIARELEAQIFALYHRSMDERLRDGQPSGDSRCGRHLFGQLAAAGAEILAAGGADSVVHPCGGRYPGDEAVFLHHIIDTIDAELRGHPQLDAAAFAGWLAERHRQIDDATLVYIAHQVDFFGRVPATARER
ncbi:MAG TPA: class I SAM-dependent methyltransferase, partial [Kofleriaceae bacterium]|nr:class I SAM-dependent methyltransferase [Kofleriaceae bacterium]